MDRNEHMAAMAGSVSPYPTEHRQLGGILPSGGVREVVNNVTGQPKDRNPNAFRKVLTEDDLVTDTKTIDSGGFTALGDPGFTIPAQEQYRWGFGAAEHEANQGYLYLNPSADAGAGDEEGVIRLQQRDAQQRQIITVMEERSEALDGSQTDRSQQRPLPEQRSYPKVGRDSYMVIAMNPDNSFDIGTASGETTFLAPVTVYPV